MSKKFGKKGFIQFVLLSIVGIITVISTITTTVNANKQINNKQTVNSLALVKSTTKSILAQNLCVPPGECLTDRNSQTCCYGDPITDISCGYSIPLRCGGGPGATVTPIPTRPPGEPTPTPTRTPTPTPPRQDLCYSSSINKSSLLPRESAIISSNSDPTKPKVKQFLYALYNPSNLYPSPPPFNAKPICVKTGGDVILPGTDCPIVDNIQTHHLIYRDPEIRYARRSGERELTYDEIFVADQNNEGLVPSEVSFMAYMRKDANSPLSLPDKNCIEKIKIRIPPPTTPTPTPPVITKTPTPPTKTPTPFPQVFCNRIDTYVTNNKGQTYIIKPGSKIEVGNYVGFKAWGSAKNTSITGMVFKLRNKESGKTVFSQTVLATYDRDARLYVGNTTPFPKSYRITIKGSYQSSAQMIKR